VIVVERCYFRDLKALLALVVEVRDIRSAFLLVEYFHLKLVDLLDDDHKERTPVDRGPGLGEVGGI